MADHTLLRMQVFLSWSGQRSRLYALALRDWLPMVVPGCQCFSSAADISAGMRWSEAIADELEQSDFGIVLLSGNNFGASWVSFESGALAKSVGSARLIPVLIDLEPGDLSGPLAQFQHVRADREGFRRITHSLSGACDGPTMLSEKQRDELFSDLWPRLESRLARALDESEPAGGDVPTPRSDADMLAELLDLSRSIRWMLGSSSAASVPSSSSDQVGIEFEDAENGTVTHYFSTSTRFQDVLEFIYRRLSSEVPAYTYGSTWVIRDSDTDESIVKRTHSRHAADTRSLSEAGFSRYSSYRVVLLGEPG